MARQSKTVTVTAGTPVVITPGTMPVPALCLIITPLHGGTVGYVLVYCNGNLVTELSPATATVPGGRFEVDRSNQGQAAKLDVNEWTIDGSTNGISVLASWEPCR